MALFGKKKEELLTELPEVLPQHVGIIMDGNGRWAKKRGLPRPMGHIEGAKTFKKISLISESCRSTHSPPRTGTVPRTR